jgi:hypothetical protein
MEPTHNTNQLLSPACALILCTILVTALMQCCLKSPSSSTSPAPCTLLTSSCILATVPAWLALVMTLLWWLCCSFRDAPGCFGSLAQVVDVGGYIDDTLMVVTQSKQSWFVQ